MFGLFRKQPAQPVTPTMPRAGPAVAAATPIAGSTLLPLYFSQSAVALVDDDLPLLKGLEGVLPTTRKFTFHAEPATFEEVLRLSEQRLRQEQQALFACVEAQTDANFAGGAQPIVLLLRHLATPLRFEITAVAVADYWMPQVDGITVLGRHNAAGLRRILLTGQADNHMAIAAFNARSIDSYLPKQSAEIGVPLMAMIDVALRESCKQRGEILSRAFSSRQAEAVAKPETQQALESTLKTLGMIEYATLASPWGLLVLTGDRRTVWVQIDDEESLAEQAERLAAIDPSQCDFDPVGASVELNSRRSSTDIALVSDLPWARVQQAPLAEIPGTYPLFLSVFELTGMPGDLAPLHHADWLRTGSQQRFS